MYCASCGEELAPDAKFCENCGTQVEQDQPAESNSTPAAEPAATDTEGATSAGSSGDEVAGGLEPNVAGALSYLLGFITGLIFFLIEDEDEFVRYHAAQSIVVFGGLFVLSIVFSVVNSVIAGLIFTGTGFFLWSLVSLLFSLIWLVIGLGSLILWIYLMVKAYEGETVRVPVAANIADDLV